MNTTEEKEFSFKDAIAELAFLAIEASQLRIQAEMNTVSEEAWDVYQEGIDRKITLIRKQIKVIEASRKLESELQARDAERS